LPQFSSMCRIVILISHMQRLKNSNGNKIDFPLFPFCLFLFLSFFLYSLPPFLPPVPPSPFLFPPSLPPNTPSFPLLTYFFFSFSFSPSAYKDFQYSLNIFSFPFPKLLSGIQVHALFSPSFFLSLPFHTTS
jgi:hypothetical protein